ncbi:uncharacterized protein LOC101742325 isoform X3 [Bombyx mori]|uniref:Protein kinase domain-containing protein n=1 Tax=Bombyx mori TaxID=7091 RepID=A0A8R2M3Y5_BOMMO|nr:uncharacterized protein LOC101742325 isoform X3 [Bombyx mori]
MTIMNILWVVLLVALTGAQFGYGLPVRPTPQAYPRDASQVLEGWDTVSGVYAALPALALVLTAVGFLLGCTWCYRHKDCKLFTASATHLHDNRRTNPPDSGFSEPANNNISEDNNNGPISLREMQNIANNNAAAYIVSENEERNRISRESVVEFEPLPTELRVADPLERCADWFSGEDFPRNQLQYLREIGRGWFGRVVEGEVDDAGPTKAVAVKILNPNANLEDKARFLDEAKLYRDSRHDTILGYVARCLQEDPWIVIFELCSTDLHQYLTVNRPKMAILNESGVPLRLMCDVTSGLSYLNSRGHLYGNLWSGNVLVRGEADNARAVLGRYTNAESPYEHDAPETRRHPPLYTASSEVWFLGNLIWEVCAWGATPVALPPPLPDLPCPYRNHLYQVMQLCWNTNPDARPTSAQVHGLIDHLYTSHTETTELSQDGSFGTSDFEERWQRLKPNTIPKIDEHVAIVHAPSTSVASHFTGSDRELDDAHTAHDTLSIDMDTAVSRSSSIMSDKDPLSVQIKSESLTNLHGSLEDVRNIYLTHNEMAALECHQGNMQLDEGREKENDKSDSSVDPWVKDIMAGSQDDVSYFKDVSDVIKNLDNMLNSEKTSSSESSHQASPSRDNLSLDCKKEYPVQSSLVKSPGINNFQNILDAGFDTNQDETEDEDVDRDTIGTLSHSFERHSDTISQQTLENLTPETPIKDLVGTGISGLNVPLDLDEVAHDEVDVRNVLPNDKVANSDSEIPKLKELCASSISSVSENIQHVRSEDCQFKCDSNVNKEIDVKEGTKSLDDNLLSSEEAGEFIEEKNDIILDSVDKNVLPNLHTNNKHELICENSGLEREDSKNESSSSYNKQNVEFSDLIENVIDNLVESHVVKSDPNKIDIVNNVVKFNDLEEIKLCESSLEPQSEGENVCNKTSDTIHFTVDSESVKKEFNALDTHEDTETSNISFLKFGEKPISTEDLPKIKMNLPKIKVNKIKCIENNIEEVPIDLNNIEQFPTSETSSQVILLLESNKQNHEKSTDTSNEQIHIVEDINNDGNVHSEEIYSKTLQNNVQATLDFIEAESIKEIDLKSSERGTAKETCSTNESGLNDLEITQSSPTATNDRVQNIENDYEMNNKTETKDLTLENTLNYLDAERTQEHKISSENTIYSFEKIDLENVEVTKLPMDIENSCDSNVCIEGVPKEIDHATALYSTVLSPEQTPSTVQNNVNIESDKASTFSENPIIHSDIKSEIFNNSQSSFLPPEEVQNSDKIFKCELDGNTTKNDTIDTSRSDYVIYDLKEQSNDSTVYLDLVENSGELKQTTKLNKDVGTMPLCLDSSGLQDISLLKNESTVYLDLPTVKVAKEIDNFLHMERLNAESCFKTGLVSSTPLGSDNSVDFADNTNNKDEEIKNILSETKVPDYGPGVTLTKLEQTFVPESLSPFESPTKSHPTDTFDENSSVVLGPFENCSLEIYKGIKSELVDLPKEELLAFSSNFSEMNLETPSPLRDVNFLNEVPDICQDEFYDITSSESKSKVEPDVNENEPKISISDPQTETNTEDSGHSVTEKHVSPSTPPNSPGVFLASTSHHKYLVNIDLDVPKEVPQSTEQVDAVQNEIDLNQIELQITSKLAMAENENNMNIEYSGPLTVEGLEDDVLEESILAGNGGSVEDLREDLTLDEECVKALRNELELKLPLAQVAAIEPQCEAERGEWTAQLPAPPELVLSYPGALSPIAEETGQQLCAYENDANWNASLLTESSESYPEPCNNWTEQSTQPPSPAPSPAPSPVPSPATYSLHTHNHTYTLHKDAPTAEVTMSADSLNASPCKGTKPDVHSPVDDRTYTKNDEKESSCERISQVSPFLVSPTTDTSDNLDNPTGVSTLSKTTLPTDAKLSKQPSECLSKATSIDSWCSNDTLYNVEENFDDLAMDPEPTKGDGNSESTDTLTHDEDDRELSHCSTYIIHDSKSEACETFSPDSIAAYDQYTYTKVRSAATAASSSQLNDSTKNSPTKDLAYGTLMSGMPSYSNCTTEVASMDDPWKFQQPELVRRSPLGEDPDLTPPKLSEDKEIENTSPRIFSEPCIKKMESVEISCLEDNFSESKNKSSSPENEALLIDIGDSPNVNYRNNMAPSITSTPLTEIVGDEDDVQAIPMTFPDDKTVNSEYVMSVPTFQNFQQSAEIRPQDLSSNTDRGTQDTEILLEGDSKTLSRYSNRDSLVVSERTPTYSDFENSATTKPQEVNSRDKSSQSMESGVSSEEFRQFENSVKHRPQDLSSLIDASSLFLRSERLLASELVVAPHSPQPTDEPTAPTTPTTPTTGPLKLTNLTESHILVDVREPTSTYLINFDLEDETEQPHSIIVTEAPLDLFKENSNVTFDSHTEKLIDLNHTYDSHTNRPELRNSIEEAHSESNGDSQPEGPHSIIDYETMQKGSPSQIETSDAISNIKSTPNGSISVDGVNGKNENYATVHFLNETFEELIESNVDDNDRDARTDEETSKNDGVSGDTKLIEESSSELRSIGSSEPSQNEGSARANGALELQNVKATTDTENFLQQEKKFCQLDSYFPILSDIRFTGPASEIMSTSFTQDSPTEPTSPECEEDNKPDAAADIVKEWDSDTESETSNSSSGEFIWKGGGGGGAALAPDARYGHQRDNAPSGGAESAEHGSEGGAGSEESGGSGDSGSEGDEVEFVPSSWDCRAAPSKSSLRSLEQAQPDGKKRVVFKRQKYHCVYEYPREVADLDAPDYSTYAEWDARSAEEAALGYGQLFAPSPLDLHSGLSFGADYDEDFFISSSARPFESLGIMSTTSQFFPGMHVKASPLPEPSPPDEAEEPPDESTGRTALPHTRAPSLDLTTPDSGVEDVTPGSAPPDDDFDKKPASPEPAWRLTDSEPTSPASPPELGGLRHTRDKLKLDLPPSPHAASPRGLRVFNFVLDKPRRSPALQPTFSTFGKCTLEPEPEQKLILTDDVEQEEVKQESPKASIEGVKGEGTVLDSGDEDSGIESSSKATLERQNKTPNVS